MNSNDVVASFGLISDTHFQDRLFELPESLASLWAGIDLVLHAGDVGELEVLDHLGRIAPVVAVHGNDEPEHVTHRLPYQQIISAHGVRILLWHSHYPDPVEERAKRGGPWGPKLERMTDYGRDMKANVVVYGHTHVPMIFRHEKVVLINPGAVASGSYFTRQTVASVGLINILANGDCDVHHFDVVTGRALTFSAPLPDEDFGLLAGRFQTWMVEPGLVEDIGALRKINYENLNGIKRTIAPLYRRCLTDGPMTRREVVEAIRGSHQITSSDRTRVLDVIDREA